jgi:hypothetical protein
MQLKFYAKKDHVVHWPGPKFTGQRHDYVGRKFEKASDDKAAKAAGVLGVHAALKEAAEIDSAAPGADDLIRYCRKGGLWPADADTAAACGVEFTKVEYSDSEREWLPAKAEKKPAARPNQTSTAAE